MAYPGEHPESPKDHNARERSTVVNPTTGKVVKPEDEVTHEEMKKGIDLDDDEETQPSTE